MISTTVNRVSYAGDGNTTAFAFPYNYLSQSDLVVVIKDGTKAETVQTISSNYVCTPTADALSGGTVTVLTAPDASSTVVIYRDKSQLQSLDLVTSGVLPSASIETNFDKLVMYIQRLQEQADRSLKLKRTDTSVTLEVPLLADRTGTVLGFDSSGRVQATAFANITGTAVSSFWSSTLGSSNASNSLVALGVSPFNVTVFDETSASNTLVQLGVSPFNVTVLDEVNASNTLVALAVSPFWTTILDETNASLSREALGTNISSLRTVTGSASLTNADQLINCSTSAQCTITLPTVTGNTGYKVRVKRIDASYSHYVAIESVSSHNIDYDNTFCTMATPNEEYSFLCDGTRWLIENHHIDNRRFAFTPTGGWSTNATYTGVFQREGQDLLLDYFVTCGGTITAGQPLTLVVPFGLTIATSSANLPNSGANIRVGDAYLLDVGNDALQGVVVYNNATSTIVRTEGGADPSLADVSQSQPWGWSTSDLVSARVRIPITNWRG